MTTTLMSVGGPLFSSESGSGVDDAEAAVAGFLARCSGRTLEAYKHDLRTFFEWATERDLGALSATRSHLELYRMTLEQRGLAPATIDRRLTTVCGFYRFAHIDGRIGANPAQYVRRPKVHPTEGHGLDRGELGRFLFSAEPVSAAHATLAVLLGLNGCGCRRPVPPTSKTLASNVATAPSPSWARVPSRY